MGKKSDIVLRSFHGNSSTMQDSMLVECTYSMAELLDQQTDQQTLATFKVSKQVSKYEGSNSWKSGLTSKQTIGLVSAHAFVTDLIC